MSEFIFTWLYNREMVGKKCVNNIIAGKSLSSNISSKHVTTSGLPGASELS